METLLEIVKYYEQLSKQAKVTYFFIEDNLELEQLLSDVNKNAHLIFTMIFFDDESNDGKIELLPLEMKKTFQNITLADLASYDFEKYRTFFNNFTLQVSDQKITDFIKTIRKINKITHSNMANLWNSNTTSKKLKKRLIKLSGLDKEKINLFLIILINKYNVKLKDYKAINITNDAYVKSAMCAIGIINSNDSYKKMVKSCKKMNHDFPGIFDSCFWMIGKYIINQNYENQLLEKCILAYQKYKH